MTTDAELVFLEKYRSLRSTRKSIRMTQFFSEELEALNKLLLQTQKERAGNKLFQVPYPYSTGNELEFRYYAYDDQQKLLFDIIKHFVPLEVQELYINKIPQSPMMILIHKVYGTTTLPSKKPMTNAKVTD